MGSKLKSIKKGDVYVVFEPEEHKYFFFNPKEGVSGELLSVNNYIYSKLYKSKSNKKDWNQYAYIGTETHKQIEEFLNGKKYIENPTKFFLTWKRFYENKLKEILKKYDYRTEEIIYSLEHLLAGQIDLVIEKDKPIIIDWKTTWNAQKFVDLYKEAIKEDTIDKKLLKRNKLARYFTQISLYSLLYEGLYNVRPKGRIVMINSDSVVVFKNEDKYLLYAEKLLLEREKELKE